MAAHGTAFDAIAPAGLMAQIADDGGAMTKAMGAGKAAADRTLAARADGATAEAAARAGKGEAAVEALARSERVSVCGDAEARARDAWADWWNATGPHDDVGDGEAAGLQGQGRTRRLEGRLGRLRRRPVPPAPASPTPAPPRWPPAKGGAP